ncbi:hypothetical protein AGOR_G00050550 [Albula goreensis]|uniref:Dynein regulatory complex protein 10 n=1 Tax=Albula goreensis TaxID=1534307 RepID=A0A8T3E0U4_9TELE|nr:hypothetical protein AGOR_G00050550 [Albula goreensis]
MVISQTLVITIGADSLKVMDLSEEKPTIQEIEATIKILEDCVWKIETVLFLPAILANSYNMSPGLEDGLVVMLQEHQQLKDQLATQYLRWLEVKGMEGNKLLSRLEQAFCGSLRNVLRRLRAHPVLLKGLSIEEIVEESKKLAESLKELQCLLMESSLTDPSAEKEERDKSRYMHELSLRHHNNMELVSTLKKEVAAATKDKDVEISKKNEIIRMLKSSLFHMEKTSKEFATRMLLDAENQNLSDRKTSEGRRTNMQQEISQLYSELNSLIIKNRELEMTLRRRKNKVDSETENWIQKYDADMSDKQVELEEVSGCCAQETAELRELEKHYAVLELEYSQIMEERKLAQEQKEKEEREKVIKDQNAVIIQAYWRGFKVRKAMKGKNKGKKGKKGKGRKTK